ncbi:MULTISPECIES: RNA methyltransferase [unclassified Meiothermus]|uniref:TrmH family RNA methyltransferase n=1 Tax=unclassified Meiothermus TaxID=370471 RepID=UPI000D7C5612|nr:MULTISPECIES: RNA methyltransferase [unclassified Meiothermus]PZA06148.1 RNA methyltransferase [Meiothermus sp. Pnk-1]RYM36212.1 RNA methyltransferase [Meiothermus sp. PNK-Is4]
MRITSPANPRIKALARLLERRHRTSEQRFLIEGAREIERALQAGIELEQALVWEGGLNPEEQRVYAALRREGLALLEVSEAVLKRLSPRENPAGIIASARSPRQTLKDYPPSSSALILVAVGLEKPGNLGALLRSADAAGAEAVLVAGGVDLYSPQVIHNSTGVVFSLRTLAASESEVLDWIQQHNLPLVAATPHTHTLYWEADLRPPVAIAVGPEHEGLSALWLKAAQTKVRIPMRGQADSLNVSVSAALLLYEALRQRLLRDGLTKMHSTL